MTLIGLVRELDNDKNLPSLLDLINRPIEEKSKIVDYMKKGNIVAVAPAIVRDVINPEIRLPELFLMSDGKYEWRSDIIYYVEKYDMALPDEFIQHVLSQVK